MTSMGPQASRLAPSQTSADPRRLRVLMIDEEFPYPPNAGKRIRSWNLLRRLASRHAIDLLCYGPLSEPAAAAAERAGVQVYTVPGLKESHGAGLYIRLFLNLFSALPFSVSKHYTNRFRDSVGALLRSGSYDLLHCEWSPYARYAEGRTPALVMAHNVEAMIWHRRAGHCANPASRWFFRQQAKKMQRFESQRLKLARTLAVVTEEDAAIFRGWGFENIALVENGVDIEYFTPSPEPEREDEILFLASLDWFPNQDALQFFVDEILPRIVAARPQAKLRVVGRRLPEPLAARIRSTASVELVGEVEDVRPELRRSAVVVVPLRIGGGSRIKILEALAAGKAVVSTTIGAEGLVVRESVAIADSAEEFADQTLQLLGNKHERRRLGSAGRQLVVERYSWDKLAQAMEAAWRETAGVQP